MNTFVIRSPCHPDSELYVETEYRGPAYMAENVPVGYSCDALFCYNQWDIHGNPI